MCIYCFSVCYILDDSYIMTELQSNNKYFMTFHKIHSYNFIKLILSYFYNRER